MLQGFEGREFGGGIMDYTVSCCLVLIGSLFCATIGVLVSRYSVRFNRTAVSAIVCVGIATLILSVLLLVEAVGHNGGLH